MDNFLDLGRGMLFVGPVTVVSTGYEYGTCFFTVGGGVCAILVHALGGKCVFS